MLAAFKITSLKNIIHKLKLNTITVYFSARDKRTPLLVRALALMVAAYALSPIDLIPDFIPVIGYLDDILIVPLGLALVIRFIPKVVMDSAKIKANELINKPISYSAAVFVVFVWVVLALFFLQWLFNIVST